MTWDDYSETFAEDTDTKKQNVIDFNKSYITSEVICIGCKERWIAVRPTGTLLKNIQCPKCKKAGYSIETGQELSE